MLSIVKVKTMFYKMVEEELSKDVIPVRTVVRTYRPTFGYPQSRLDNDGFPKTTNVYASVNFGIGKQYWDDKEIPIEHAKIDHEIKKSDTEEIIRDAMFNTRDNIFNFVKTDNKKVFVLSPMLFGRVDMKGIISVGKESAYAVLIRHATDRIVRRVKIEKGKTLFVMANFYYLSDAFLPYSYAISDKNNSAFWLIPTKSKITFDEIINSIYIMIEGKDNFVYSIANVKEDFFDSFVDTVKKEGLDYSVKFSGSECLLSITGTDSNRLYKNWREGSDVL